VYEVKYHDYMGNHKIYAVKGKGPSLLVKHIHLDWASIKRLSTSGTDQYAEVFQDSLGTMKQLKGG